MKFYYYKITNVKNGSFYIGITTDVLKRKRQHFSQLNCNVHANYKMQKDYNIYGKDAFNFEIIDEYDGDVEEAYEKEYELIQQTQATNSYNILEGGKLNPVYSSQALEKLKKTHQAKYPDILQYEFNGKSFILKQRFNGIRDASRNGEHDFRAIQNSIKSTQTHHGYYWVKDGEQEIWLNKFLNRHTCPVAKINEETNKIEDTALTIKEFANKYNTTYDRIYASIIQNNRCEKKYKFIRITAKQFAEINNLSL